VPLPILISFWTNHSVAILIAFFTLSFSILSKIVPASGEIAKETAILTIFSKYSLGSSTKAYSSSFC